MTNPALFEYGQVWARKGNPVKIHHVGISAVTVRRVARETFADVPGARMIVVRMHLFNGKPGGYVRVK